MSNHCPTMDKASENISQICNPKKSEEEKYWDAQSDVDNILGELQ